MLSESPKNGTFLISEEQFASTINYLHRMTGQRHIGGGGETDSGRNKPTKPAYRIKSDIKWRG